MKRQRIDQKFQKFGRLLVLGIYGKDKVGRKLMLAWCQCGNLAVVRADNLKQTATTGNKNSTSCGCLRRAASSKRSKDMWADPDRADAIMKKMNQNWNPRGKDKAQRKRRTPCAVQGM